MADLEFGKQVPGVRGGADLPTYKRSETLKVQPVPDIQGPMTAYANATNWMSSLGSYVATRASNALATELGARLGKNPQGDVGIPLTEFDSVMQKSYQTQAHATLGLQAHKLISDANLELAKSPRITPALIDRANQTISLGLQNIFKNAPTEIKPQLEYQYTQVQINQASDLTQRMIREQQEDLKHNVAHASNVNAESAYSLAINGNYKAAESLVKTTDDANQPLVKMGLSHPESAKTNTDTVRKSYLSGKYIHLWKQAEHEGKGEEFLRNLAENKPADVSDSDYFTINNNVLQYVNQQQSLRHQDEQFRVAKMNVSIAKDVMGITGAQMDEYKQNVSPVQFQRTQIDYINAMKAFNKSRDDMNSVIKSWGDSSEWARKPNEAINKGFDLLTTAYMQNSQQRGAQIPREEAEVQVAASAGGPIPVFTEQLSHNLNSGNPQMMDIAVRQMDSLYNMNAGKAIRSLDEKDKAIYAKYKDLRASLPPEEAAKVVTQNMNQDPEIQKMNKEKWVSFVRSKTRGLVPDPTFALQQVGLKTTEFINPGTANSYGQTIFENYQSYFTMLNGDDKTALKLIKQDVKENYGYTKINGHETVTLHPIEKVLGYENNVDVIPYIRDDMVNQLNSSIDMPRVPIKEKDEKGNETVKMISMKDAYHKNLISEYWEVLPRYRSEPVKVKKVSNGKTETYNVILLGNAFNWDVSLETESGMRPLMQMAPYLRVATYTPNKSSIDKAYLKDHGVS